MENDVFNEKDVAEIISENLGDRELSKDFLDGKLRNFEEMKINSIAFVKIIIAVEDKYNIKFESRKMDTDEFICVQDFYDYIRQKISERK